MTSLFSPEQEQLIVNEYASGLTIKKLALHYCVSQATIQRTLVRNDFPRRIRKYDIDETVFNNITEESAYWVGFLMADGCINRHPYGGNPTVNITLKGSDDGHLNKFKLFLKTDKPLYYSKNGQVHIQISSSEICERLISFGVTERKTYNNAEVVELENNRHFWRGLFDGDGCISEMKEEGDKRYWKITLTGSENMIEQFISFIKNIYPGVGGSTRTIPMASGSEHDNVMEWTTGGYGNPMRVLKILYDDCSVYLDRKIGIYREMLLCSHGRRKIYE